MGTGLAALMGALSGTASLPEGMIAADKQRTADEHLAETKRHAQVLEGQLNTPLGTLYDTLGLPTPQGVDPTKPVPTSLLPHAYGALEKEQARQAAAAKSSYLDQALGKAATDFGTPGTAPRVGAMTEPEAAGTQPAATVTPHPGISLLRQVIPGLDPEKVTPAVTELIKELKPGGGKVTPHFQQGQNGLYQINTDEKGNRLSVDDVGIGVPESRNAQYQQAKKDMLAEGSWGRPGEQRFESELNRRIEQYIVAPPGSDVIPKRNMPSAGPAPQSAPPAGTPPGAAWRNAPAVSEATGMAYASGKLAAEHMGVLANDIERLAPDSKVRISLAFRQMLNSVPIANATPQVSPEEQDVITRLQHLQLRYENAMGGLRAAGSPQFYDRMKGIFGGVDKATVGPSLRALSKELRDFLGDVQQVEGSQGKRPLPGIAPAPAPVQSQEAPWTDLGGGVRIREKR